VQGIQIELRRMQERAIQESTTITFDIYLMDAMGVKHRIPMSMARTLEVCVLEADQKNNSNNYQQFKRAIGVVYTPNSQRDVILRRYLEADQFHLGIDNGNQVVEIKSDEDLQELVQPGATVVQSIVILRKQSTAERYPCPSCNRWNYRKAMHSAIEW
jgi:hypothetical protein